MTRGELLRTLPPVLRARGCFLYLPGGRLTDLWLWGGRAVLGHKGSLLVRDLKNAAERGLFAPFPHPLEGRFLKALAQLLPGRCFRVYGPGSAVDQVLEAAGFDPRGVRDPAMAGEPGGEGGTGAVSLWRPFLEEPLGAYPVLLPVLPEPGGLRVFALEPGLEGAFPPSDLLSPVLLAPACRGVYNLLRATPARGLSWVDRTLKGPACPWRRRGIYLSLKERVTPPAWEEIFRRFLEGGFLIPPGPGEPLILPQALPKGIGARLAGLLGCPPDPQPNSINLSPN